MTVLVDTGVWDADHNTDAARYAVAKASLRSIYHGELGQSYISDYVFDEVVTLTRTRTGSHVAAKKLSDRLRGQDTYPRVYELLRVSSAVFSDSIDTNGMTITR